MSSEIISIIVGFIIGYMVGRLRKTQPVFLIGKDKDGKQTIEIVPQPGSRGGKAEFLEESTQEQLDEMNQPKKLRKFMKKFKKVEK